MMNTVHKYQPTNHFTKKLSHLNKTDPLGYKRIRKTIQRLLEKPGESDGKMVGIYHGKLKKYVGRQDYRIIYHWCEICRKENQRREDCDIIPDNSVIFFDIYHKKDQKRIKKNRKQL